MTGIDTLPHPTEGLPRAKLEQLQFSRLLAQVERCYNSSAFYRQLYDAAGVQPSQITSLADVHRLPIITKKDLWRSQQAHRPYGSYLTTPVQQGREVHTSTGTSGMPLWVLWTATDIENLQEHTVRALRTAGVRPGDVVQNCFRYDLWFGQAFHQAALALGCRVIPAGQEPIRRQLECLTNLDPTVLISTPSHALYLAEKLRTYMISPRSLNLRLGLFGGEVGASVAGTRAQIENSLNLQVRDIYGIGEVAPAIAVECPEAAGLHWAEDHYLIEVLDPATLKPVSPHQPGVLVVSTLVREGNPLLRCWTNDIAVIDLSPCACGRTHLRLVGGIQGRADDLIILRGHNFYPSQVEEVLRRFPELGIEYRILLERDATTYLDSCILEVESLYAVPAQYLLPDRIAREVSDQLGIEVQVIVLAPGVLERSTFKASRVIDRRLRLKEGG